MWLASPKTTQVAILIHSVMLPHIHLSLQLCPLLPPSLDSRPWSAHHVGRSFLLQLPLTVGGLSRSTLLFERKVRRRHNVYLDMLRKCVWHNPYHADGLERNTEKIVI